MEQDEARRVGSMERSYRRRKRLRDDLNSGVQVAANKKHASDMDRHRRQLADLAKIPAGSYYRSIPTTTSVVN